MQGAERLMMVTDMAAGSGSLKKGAHRSHVAALRRQARGRRLRPEPEPSTRSAEVSTRSAAVPDAATLATFGVELVEVKVNQKELAGG